MGRAVAGLLGLIVASGGAVGCASREREPADAAPCRAEPLAQYQAQRPDIAEPQRHAEAARAVLDACPHRLRTIQRQLLHADTLEAPDQRATALMDIDATSRDQFWSSVCPQSFIERPDPAWGRARHLEQWEACELAPLSPFLPEELHGDIWRPVLWEVARRLEQGGVEPGLARSITRDATAELEPAVASWAVSRARRPSPPDAVWSYDSERDGLHGVEIDATTTAERFESTLEYAIRESNEPRVFARVRSANPWQSTAVIELHPLSRGGKGLDVSLSEQGTSVEGEPQTPAQILARAGTGVTWYALRLHVDEDQTWQQVVRTIDELMAPCGGWRPYLEADPEELGPQCPFTRIELGVEHPRWQRLQMVIEVWHERRKHPRYDRAAMEARIEKARPGIEACMRASERLRRSDPRQMTITFLANPNGRLTGRSFTSEVYDSSPEEASVTDCVDRALGFESIEHYTRSFEHGLADVTLGVQLPE